MKEIIRKIKWWFIRNNFFKYTFIEQPFICDYGYNIEIGKNFYANHNLVILDGNKVIINESEYRIREEEKS